MLVVSVNELKENLHTYLDKISKGEKVIIRQDEKNIACISRIDESDWRGKMTVTPKLNVSLEEIMGPVSDIWTDYL